MKERFSNLFRDCTRYARKYKTSEYEQNGTFPIIDQGKEMIAGFCSSGKGVFEDVPAIIFGDHTRIIKYIDRPFFLGADGAKVLLQKNKAHNCKYLYYALRNVKIPNTGYNRHYKWLKEASIRITDRRAQDKIVSILDHVSGITERHNLSLRKLNELVKCRFVEMFGDPVQNNLNWDRYPISEVAPIVEASKPDGNIVWLLNLDMVRAQTGEIISYTYLPFDKIGTSTCFFDNKNVLYSKLRPYLNKVVLPDRAGCATSELVPLRPNAMLNRSFLAYLLRSDSFVAFISDKVAGAEMPRVSMDIFKNFKCICPPINIQEEFSAFVQQLDKSRVAIQRSMEETQKLFDSLMHQYFD